MQAGGHRFDSDILHFNLRSIMRKKITGRNSEIELKIKNSLSNEIAEKY